MTTHSWIRRLFARTPRTPRKAATRYRLGVEALETRLAPSVSNGLIAFSSLRDGGGLVVR